MTSAVKILVTGAAGFLGRRLIAALLAGSTPHAGRHARHRRRPAPMPDRRPAGRSTRRRRSRTPAFVRSLVERDVDVVFHLAAVLSGQSEAEFDVGMRVNVDGTRALLEACRASGRARRGSSSRARSPRSAGRCQPSCPRSRRCGPSRRTAPRRRSLRLLVTRVLAARLRGRHRLPRADRGDPSGETQLGALVVRERHRPRAAGGHRCRLSRAARHAACGSRRRTPRRGTWCTPARVPASALGGPPVVNLPGLSVTPGEMLDSLERLARRRRQRTRPRRGRPAHGAHRRHVARRVRRHAPARARLSPRWRHRLDRPPVHGGALSERVDAELQGMRFDGARENCGSTA